MKYILSFGAGVNSTAILALVELKQLDLGDLDIIFADTQAENPETYCHIESMKKKFSIIILRKEQSLYEYCFEKRIIPSRMLRWCTDKWKIRPIANRVQELYGNEYKLIFGFCKGEERRSRNNQEAIYPLIQQGIDREKCINLIKQVGWKVPPKSGCFFCPFQHKMGWLALRENKPYLWKLAVKLEENALQRYPKMFLYGDKPLTELDASQQRLTPLPFYQHCMCASG
jgi:hypothetical protein